MSSFFRKRYRRISREFAGTPVRLLGAATLLLGLWWTCGTFFCRMLRSQGLDFTTANFIGALFVNAITLFLAWRWLWGSPPLRRRQLGVTGHQALRNILVGLQVGCVFSVSSILVARMESDVGRIYVDHQQWDAWLAHSTSLSGLALGLAAVVLAAPLVEEFLFRGLLYSTLRRVSGVWPAILVTALLFAGVHPQSLGSLAFWRHCASGLLYGYCRERTSSLIPPVILHMLHNLAVTLGIWNGAIVLRSFSWKSIGLLFLVLGFAYAVLALARRRLLRHAHSSPEHVEAQRDLLSCPVCAARVSSSDFSTRCPACGYLWGSPKTRTSLFFEIAGALILVTAGCSPFLMTSDLILRSPSLSFYRAAYLLSRGDRDEALMLSRLALERHPDAHRVRLIIADVLRLRGDYDQAIEALEMVSPTDCQSFKGWHNVTLARCYADAETYLDKAIALANEAVSESKPGSSLHANAHEVLGWIHFRRGAYELADWYIERALALTRRSSRIELAEFYYHRGMIHLRQGYASRARRELQQAVGAGDTGAHYYPEAKAALEESATRR